MLSKTINLVRTFITIIIIVGVEGLEPVEAWHDSWFLSSEVLEANRKRDKAIRRINDQKDADLMQLIMDTEAHERWRKDQEREQRRKAFREWKAGCDRIFNPTISTAAS